MLESGAEVFLQQAHRNNWQHYLAFLQPDAPQGWDVCVLTASNQHQADMYRRQIQIRAQAGLLPPRTRFVVIADPQGVRIGSGGATLRVLRYLSERDGLLSDPTRVLVIHSGGDSRRLPHCSAIGKLFARIPRALPDGRASTLFDEFLIGLSGAASGLSPGVLVASGDVLLLFDHLQLTFQRAGVTGVAAAAPAEMGTQHGVYVCDSDRHLRAYLHKPSIDQLVKWEAISPSGQVDIDTGLVWFDAQTTQTLCTLAQAPSLSAFCGKEAGCVPLQVGLNLYGDLLLPLDRSTVLDQYLADTSDGPATSLVRAARQTIWQHLRGVPFAVDRLRRAAFLHFGTSQAYWSLLADSPALSRTCGWTAHTASWISTDSMNGCVEVTAINALLENEVNVTSPVLISDAHLSGSLSAAGPALVSGVISTQPLTLVPDTVIHQLPVDDGFVTRIYGLGDDPKHIIGDPAATFMNLPWNEWLRAAEVDADLLWPGVPQHKRTLWNAQLYPVTRGRQESVGLSLPLQSPGQAPPEWVDQWTGSRRLSLAESFARANSGQILADLVGIQDAIAVRHFCASVADERPATEICPLLGTQPETITRRAEQVAQQLRQDPLLVRLRGYQALAIATKQQEWEDRAFHTLSDMIERSVDMHRAKRTRVPGLYPDANELPISVRVEAAARIDFGGGWTDTPPYSIERGGTVLNAAVTLKGQPPIIAQAERLSDSRIVLECGDIGARLEPTLLAEVLAHRDPADPFALLKAALVLRDVVPADGDPDLPMAELLQQGGLRLRTQTEIPRGSGLGTSSIMAGAVLSALARVQGIEMPQRQLFEEVLCLEQMMTTGGGWQDQVGGLTPGVKLVTSGPGLPQHIQVAPLRLAPAIDAELADRLLLVYTGQRRLAKNLLQRVMGRWMARDPEMVWIQGEIARLAIEMRDALQAGDIDTFGALLTEHWTLNKRMDPGCTNPFIDALFEVMGPYISGGKLAGAGGGGFAIVVARDGDKAEGLRIVLTERYAGAGVGIWPCTVPNEGMVAS
jgi:fucokinase